MLLAIESCTHKQSLVSMINPFELVAFMPHDPRLSSLHLAHPCWENFREISRSEEGAAIVLWCNREGRVVSVEGQEEWRGMSVEGRRVNHCYSLPLDIRHSVLGYSATCHLTT